VDDEPNDNQATIIVTISRIASTPDGGVRYTFDGDGSQGAIVAWLMGIKFANGLLKLTIEREEGQTSE